MQSNDDLMGGVYKLPEDIQLNTNLDDCQPVEVISPNGESEIAWAFATYHKMLPASQSNANVAEQETKISKNVFVEDTNFTQLEKEETEGDFREVSNNENPNICSYKDYYEVNESIPRKDNGQLNRQYQAPLGLKDKVNARKPLLICSVVIFLILTLTVTIFLLTEPTAKRVNLMIVLNSQLIQNYVISQDLAEQAHAINLLKASIELSGQAEATGTKEIPDKRAFGSVRFLNSSASPIFLPAGTLVATVNKVSYRLAQDVNIPATNLSTESAGFADSVIEADQAGPVGNLANGIGTFTLRGGVLSVGSLGAISGGTNRIAKIVTDEDISNLEQQLQQELPQKANDALNAKLDNAWLRPDENFDVVKQVEVERPTAGTEMTTSQFKVTIDIYVQAEEVQPNLLITLLPDVRNEVGDGTAVSTNNNNSASNENYPNLSQLIKLGSINFISVAFTNTSVSQSSAANKSLNVTYSRSIDGSQLIKWLTAQTFQSSSDFDHLIAELKTRPEINKISVIDLNANSQNLSKQVIVNSVIDH